MNPLPNHNKNILREESFRLSEGKRHLRERWDRRTLWKYIRRGRKHPVTKETIYMEACFGPSGEIITSAAAYRRFMERINGET